MGSSTPSANKVRGASPLGASHALALQLLGSRFFSISLFFQDHFTLPIYERQGQCRREGRRARAEGEGAIRNSVPSGCPVADEGFFHEHAAIGGRPAEPHAEGPCHCRFWNAAVWACALPAVPSHGSRGLWGPRERCGGARRVKNRQKAAKA